MSAAEDVDTSGVIILDGVPVSWNPGAHEGGTTSWLAPFAQGYVGALLGSPIMGRFGPLNLRPRFGDLAPEALALIASDCEELTRPERYTFADTADAGSFCWRMRQAGWPGLTGGPALRDEFRPLTAQFGEDGKIRLRLADEPEDPPAAQS